MNRIEDIMNRMTDMDWGWWPLLRLRPSKDRDIDNPVLLRLTLFFGPFVGICAILVITLLYRLPPLLYLVCALPAACLGFFFGYKFSFALFWNRRAARLRNALPSNNLGNGDTQIVDDPAS